MLGLILVTGEFITLSRKLSLCALICAMMTVFAAPSADARPLNLQGELLVETDEFLVYKLVTFDGDDISWCNGYKFGVSAVAKAGVDQQFTRAYMHETLFADVLPQLKDQLCPGAVGAISATVFLRDIFIMHNGQITTREQAIDSPTYNKRIVAASYYADFSGAGPTPRPSVSDVRLVLNTTVDDVARYERYASSVSGLQAFHANNQRTPEGVAADAQAERDRQAQREAMMAALEARFGMRPQSREIALILAGRGDEVRWSDPTAWRYLRTYIYRTSATCGSNTVGEGQQVQLRFRSNTVDAAAPYGMWMSTRVEAVSKGWPYGNELTGLLPAEQPTAADVDALIAANGCGSEPLARLEDFFVERLS